MHKVTTYTKRINARRAAVAAGIPVELVEITVHKSVEGVRFGWKVKGNGDIPLDFIDEINAHQRPHRARQILRLASKVRTALAYQVYARQRNRDKYVCDC